MIPFAYITEWRATAPWGSDAQVEQDLILSRAIVALYSDPELSQQLGFRGGTALYKLFLQPPARYSEDLDFVQLEPGPIGAILDGIRRVLDPWLGTPKRKMGEGRVVLMYRVTSETLPPVPMRLKVEINSREHFAVFGIESREFSMRSRWFSGAAQVKTYQLDELLGTKLRALYQRKKGRDLFDLLVANQRAVVDSTRVVECFMRYLEHEGLRVSRAEYERNLDEKLDDDVFLSDIAPLIAPDVPWSVEDAVALMRGRILPLLPGAPWKGTDSSSR